VDRLETAGMVSRSACASDARGAEAILTADGLRRLRAASRTHLAGIERYFLDVVEPADRAAMERGLAKVMSELDTGVTPDTACAIPS